MSIMIFISAADAVAVAAVAVHSLQSFVIALIGLLPLWQLV